MNREMSASDLLRNAATLIDRALLKLDGTSAECAHCRSVQFKNRAQGRVYQQFAETPDKLKKAAARLENSEGAGPDEGFDAAMREFHEKAGNR